MHDNDAAETQLEHASSALAESLQHRLDPRDRFILRPIRVGADDQQGTLRIGVVIARTLDGFDLRLASEIDPQLITESNIGLEACCDMLLREWRDALARSALDDGGVC